MTWFEWFERVGGWRGGGQRVEVCEVLGDLRLRLVKVEVQVPSTSWHIGLGTTTEKSRRDQER
jgi:hypothetical protein